jgi:hypothetical protein
MKGRLASPRRLAIGACLAALGGALLAVAVAAHTVRYPSSIELHAFTVGSSNNYVYGAISSPNSNCVGGRKVRVYRKTQGSDAKLGADVSQEASGVGPYTVTAPSGDLHPGRYYSQVHKRDLRPGPRHAHICKGARSDGLDVGP